MTPRSGVGMGSAADRHGVRNRSQMVMAQWANTFQLQESKANAKRLLEDFVGKGLAGTRGFWRAEVRSTVLNTPCLSPPLQQPRS